MHAHDALVRLVLVLWKSAHLPFGSGAVWLETATLFCALGSEIYFTDEESGMLWEDTLFELQNAVEWRMFMSRGPNERAQVHSMSYLLSTCDGTTYSELIAMQGEQQRERLV